MSRGQSGKERSCRSQERNEPMPASKPWGECRPRGLAALAFAALEWRIIRGPLKRPVYRFIQERCGPQDVEYQGLKFRCYIADNGPERFVIFQSRSGEREALRLSTQPLRPGDTFVDIGANFGLFSVIAAQKVGPAGRVVAIEPLPELVERLRFNISINGFENVSIFPVAVGERAGDAVLYVSDSSRAESSVVNPDGKNSVAVPMMPLLQVVENAKLSRIDAMKIDVEGYEDRVLVPFFATAGRSLWPRLIYMETLHAQRWATDCLKELLAKGYRIERESKGDVCLQLAS
jgi:FkbM family methyltransferase